MKVIQELVAYFERRGKLKPAQMDRLLRGERNGFFYGQFKVLYQVGAGTFARVYRAVNRDTGQEPPDLSQQGGANEQDGLAQISDSISLDEPRIPVRPTPRARHVSEHEPPESVHGGGVCAVHVPRHDVTGLARSPLPFPDPLHRGSPHHGSLLCFD